MSFYALCPNDGTHCTVTESGCVCSVCGWTATVTECFEPDPPLNNAAGSRLLAKITSFLVKCKDRTMTPEEDALVNEAVDNFLSPFRNRNQVGPKVAGSPK